MPAATIRRHSPGAGTGAERRGAPATPHLALVAIAPAPLELSRDREPEIAVAPPAGGRPPREAFGARLKAARERRGVTLSAVAAATKVSASHFAALERGDISRWPKGLYRRSFFRSYAVAIGLPPESVVDEFVRLFDDGPREAAEQAPAVEAEPETPSLRLTMGTESRRDALQRICSRAGAIDALVVLVAAVALAWWSGAGPAAGLAMVALSCYPQAARALRKRTPRVAGKLRANRS